RNKTSNSGNGQSHATLPTSLQKRQRQLKTTGRPSEWMDSRTTEIEESAESKTLAFRSFHNCQETNNTRGSSQRGDAKLSRPWCSATSPETSCHGRERVAQPEGESIIKALCHFSPKEINNKEMRYGCRVQVLIDRSDIDQLATFLI
ncbi:Os05g0114950, partial [Oryza sativa Japonica Group]